MPLSDDLLAKLHKEAIWMLALCRYHSGVYWDCLVEVPTSVMHEARSWLTPGWNSPSGKRAVTVLQKPMKTMPAEVRFRRRCRNLMERAERLYSLPDLRLEWLQSEVSDNAGYFGCCSLPGVNFSTKVSFSDHWKKQAVDKENAIRADENSLVSGYGDLGI